MRAPGGGGRRGRIGTLVAGLLLAGCAADTGPLPLRPVAARDAVLTAAYRAAPAPLFAPGPRRDAVVAALVGSAAQGLDPDSYLTPALRRALGGRDVARADRLLTAALLRWAEDVGTSHAVPAPIVADAAAAPPDPARLLQTLVVAPDLADELAALARRHPLFDRYARALAVDPGNAALAASLDRARALPGVLPARHIIVDLAGQRLWMYDGDRPSGSMKVVIGKPDQPTPLLASAVRQIILNPYWNVPVDLVPGRVARPVLANGVAALRAERFEVLSGWDEDARPLDPRKVPWARVASGALELRVRQRPHPGNMMGTMKFLLPNDLGIYLHDTPLRADFARRIRAASSGCVRLEDARRLAGWLMAGRPLPKQPRPEQVVTLPEPVPIYLTDLAADPETLAPQPDVYGLRRVAVAAR